tara:strand:+ start:104 stop:319 length:216 start_codon:yes stop_codon:yes gene_type:complete
MKSFLFLIFISGFLCFCQSTGNENKSAQDINKDPVVVVFLTKPIPDNYFLHTDMQGNAQKRCKVSSLQRKK